MMYLAAPVGMIVYPAVQGDDIIYGASGADVLTGDIGDDLIFNGAGDDVAQGGDGDDTLWAGSGDDLLTGGAGEDTFSFGSNSGTDTISDFTVDEDTLDLSFVGEGFSDAASVVAAASEEDRDGTSGVLIALGDDNSVFLENLTLSDLSNSSFIFG